MKPGKLSPSSRSAFMLAKPSAHPESHAAIGEVPSHESAEPGPKVAAPRRSSAAASSTARAARAWTLDGASGVAWSRVRSASPTMAGATAAPSKRAVGAGGRARSRVGRPSGGSQCRAAVHPCVDRVYPRPEQAAVVRVSLTRLVRRVCGERDALFQQWLLVTLLLRYARRAVQAGEQLALQIEAGTCLWCALCPLPVQGVDARSV
eukprot:scaffold9942_cov57-Phaeocystis_antarctica.AAC.4